MIIYIYWVKHQRSRFTIKISIPFFISLQQSSSSRETEEPQRNPEAEITKAAPPSYHVALNYPKADPSQAPPTELPPPYPGPPADLKVTDEKYSGGATTGYPPPASSNYPSIGPNYQGYPPPANLAYPPSTAPVGLIGTPALDLAFPPNTGEG